MEKVGFVCWNSALCTPFIVRKQNISRDQFISSWSGSLHLVSRIRSEKCCFCQLNIKVVQTSSVDVDSCISADDSWLLTRSFRLQCKSNDKDIFQLNLKQRTSLLAITLLLKIVAQKTEEGSSFRESPFSTTVLKASVDDVKMEVVVLKTNK